MRRMYGDIRHISVLKEEFENNEIDIDDINRATERYARPSLTVRDGKRMKYLRPSLSSHFDTGHVHYPRDKSNEIPFNEPHFRPTQGKATTVPSSTTTISFTTKNSATATLTVTTDSSTVKSALTTVPNSSTTSTTVESPPPEKASSETYSTESIYSSTLVAQRVPENDNFFQNGTQPKIVVETTASTQIDGYAIGKDGLQSNKIEKAEDASSTNTIPSTDSEGINMNALSSLAKLETNGEVKTIDDSVHKDIEGKYEKISSTLKLTGFSSDDETDYKAVPVTNGGSITDEIEFTINNNPNERQDTGITVETDEVVVDQEHPSNDTPVAEPVVQLEAAPTNKTNQQQKIRFESIKHHSGAVGLGSSGTTPAKKPNSEGQLFQDTAQKEQTVVNGRGVNACPVKEEVVAPFWANNTRGEVLALLNLYPFEQYVHWEKCTHELKQMYCRDGCRCEQQYRLHRLLAYDPHNECRGIFSDWFRFPSCCICKCYDMPFDFRVTSRSPRSLTKESIELVEDELQNAIYEHAVDEWYRPKEYNVD
ncbi:protein spaetzle 4 [Anopheles nili]|uniref:protein spaetzle 4 n=1 Tax=Anopheles nili TaxID=185578 RepID=UPI00237AAB94|nr:protein spaetzle 4 [Anopheles nili]